MAQIKAWTERLHAAINLSNTLPLHPGISSIYVLHQSRGSWYIKIIHDIECPETPAADQRIMHKIN
ncbi:hypothetical protein PQM29_001014 [Morganella morganii]|uniref:hypothetical protein n=1 Tax=Morganella morganii TaxID=582 RepID=UPI003D7DC6E9